MAVNFMKIRNGISFAPGLASAPSNPVNGDIYFDSTLGKFQKYENGAWGPLGSGNGSGINYVLNSDFEVDTAGYNTYADAAGVAPVDGTGGSPNVTITRTTSAPLRGQGSGLLNKDAANRQGEGWSYDFLIEDADRAKQLLFKFDYILASGTFEAGDPFTESDIEMWVYDITNARLIPVTPYKLSSNSGTVPSTFTGVFQSSADSVSYRLIWHVATTNASAWTVKIDTVAVGPQAVLYAPSVSDVNNHLDILPSSGFGTPIGLIGNTYSWRIGDRLHMRGYFTAGTVGASTAYFGLPFPIDIDKITTTSDIQKVGTWTQTTSATTFIVDPNVSGDIFYDTSTPDRVYLATSVGGNTYQFANVNSFMNNGISITYEFSYPVAGWSSNTVTGNDADARPVTGAANKQSSQTLPNNVLTKVTWTNLDFDTHNAFEGLSNSRYVAPVSGYYHVSVALEFVNTSAVGLRQTLLYLNGAPYAPIGFNSPGTVGSANAEEHIGSIVLKLVAGDYLEVYAQQQSGGNLDVAPSGELFNRFTVQKVSGPALPLATERVAFSIWQSSATVGITPAATDIQLTYDMVDFDTHKAFNTSTNEYKAPVSGTYQINMQVRINGGGAAAELRAIIYKNGSTYIEFNHNKANTGGDGIQGAIALDLVAGDVLTFFAWDNTGANSAAGGVQRGIMVSGHLVK